tara:strand:- start:4405 stop:4830 length:426 start_codon:yes stop_codon:yes gene_type:complete
MLRTAGWHKDCSTYIASAGKAVAAGTSPRGMHGNGAQAHCNRASNDRESDGMQTDLTTAEGKFRRTVGDVVVAEMLFIQATVESASVIGTGLQQLGHHLMAAPSDPQQPIGSIASLLQATADRALEPYSTRLGYFRQLRTL